MKKAILTIAVLVSAQAWARSDDDRRYNPHSYGAPQLYYDQEARRERQERELLQENNRIEKERLEVEKEQLREIREEKRESDEF